MAGTGRAWFHLHGNFDVVIWAGVGSRGLSFGAFGGELDIIDGFATLGFDWHFQ